jgi:hypothetical protein
MTGNTLPAHSPVTGFLQRVEAAIERFPRMLPLAIYVAFAACVYFVHGPEPSLSIDHIPYFKLADEILRLYPDGDYWRSFNSVRAYGVLLAYLHHLTGSHLISLKLVLAGITVLYLASFQLFMSLATARRAFAVLFALLSAFFVTFGASIWGMTDFAASLNRSVIIPPVMVLIWYFFANFSSPRRYIVFPSLILLSLAHLSALHVFGVFLGFEIMDYVFRRRFRIDRNIAWFVLALFSSVMLQATLENLGGGTTNYVRYTLNMAAPELAEKLPSLPAALSGPKPPASALPPRLPGRPEKLTMHEAWKIEIMAFPWRNFPPSFATLATIASSFGVILFLALWGGARVLRRRIAGPLDWHMIRFAAGTLLAAYGLQVLLWVVRRYATVLPINFEEVRAINMLMVPAIYFVFRQFETAPPDARPSRAAFRALVVAAVVLQPIVIVKAMPIEWREAIIARAIDMGIIRSSDPPRMLYARQFLGLATTGHRFYYASKPALEWLEDHALPGETVLTRLDEFHMSRVKAVGPFLGIVNLDAWDPRRQTWSETLEAVDRALAAKDLERVKRLARVLHANYAIVDWPVPDALYHDQYYSIIRVELDESQEDEEGR